MLVDPRYPNVSFENVMAAMDDSGLLGDGKLQMYKERRFGIDWGVGPQISGEATDKDDWETSMDNMWKLCRDGCLVFLPATNTPNVEGGLIGQVPVGADIELVDYDDGSGETLTMKTLKLQRVREVHPDDDTGVLEEVQWGHHTVHNIPTHGEKVVKAYEKLY